MDPQSFWQLLADIVLTVHFAIVLFVVGGLVLIVAGNVSGRAGLRWVNALWFRILHLAAIAVVVMEAWFGIECPLTTLEVWLRMQGGAAVHDQSFIAYWLQRLLFYEAPGWVFLLAYSLFGLLVVAAWWYFPPQRSRPRRRAGHPNHNRSGKAQ